jgi:hypothetical protein
LVGLSLHSLRACVKRSPNRSGEEFLHHSLVEGAGFGKPCLELQRALDSWREKVSPAKSARKIACIGERVHG